MSKNNIFLFSPGGYGPNVRLDFWAGKLKLEDEKDEDEWREAADDFVEHQDVDYGCYYMSRKDAEAALARLKSLLEEE